MLRFYDINKKKISILKAYKAMGINELKENINEVKTSERRRSYNRGVTITYNLVDCAIGHKRPDFIWENFFPYEENADKKEVLKSFVFFMKTLQSSSPYYVLDEYFEFNDNCIFTRGYRNALLRWNGGTVTYMIPSSKVIYEEIKKALIRYQYRCLKHEQEDIQLWIDSIKVEKKISASNAGKNQRRRK